MKKRGRHDRYHHLPPLRSRAPRSLLRPMWGAHQERCRTDATIGATPEIFTWRRRATAARADCDVAADLDGDDRVEPGRVHLARNALIAAVSRGWHGPTAIAEPVGAKSAATAIGITTRQWISDTNRAACSWWALSASARRIRSTASWR